MYSVTLTSFALLKACSTVPSKKFFSFSVWSISGKKLIALALSVVDTDLPTLEFELDEVVEELLLDPLLPLLP